MIDTYNQGYGAVGNAVWYEKELMFVTYEESPMIVWASTTTLEKVGEFDTGVSNLAGIVVDEVAEYIYVVQRGTDNLYVYSFDETNNTLDLVEHQDLTAPDAPIEAWGLALDEGDGLLYVSCADQWVEVFRTWDWGHDHYIEIKVGEELRAGAANIRWP